MAITYGFFNSMGGDRTYNADQMSEYFSGLISDGVFENVGDALQVIPGDGMTAKVKTGRAIIKCKWLENDAKNLVCKVVALPAREDIDFEFNEQLIVELYSK